MIREARAEDKGAIVQMGKRFIAESPYGSFFNASPDALAATFEGVLASEDGKVFVLDVNGDVAGMLLAVIYAHPFSGERVAQEIAWWVDPEARKSGGGVRLVHALEDWARDSGATALQMIAPNADVEALYDRMGYRRLETAFQRSL